jgi:hypothetical protein
LARDGPQRGAGEARAVHVRRRGQRRDHDCFAPRLLRCRMDQRGRKRHFGVLPCYAQ